jgi:hypothetical protein
MSIRLIAKELYRLFQESEKIRKQLDSAPVFERVKLEEQLKRMKAEENQMRRTLAGAIEKK